MDEKYPGYCSRCVEYPPSGKPWCSVCYREKGERPMAFWGLTDGDARFFYKCECGFETPRDIVSSGAFGEVLRDHFFEGHGMYISDALNKAGAITTDVASKYFPKSPLRKKL